MPEQFSYLIHILKFTGIPILLIWLIGYKHLRKHTSKILLMGVMGVLFTLPIEGIGIKIGAWSFSPNTSFDSLLLGAEIETYVFSFLVGIAVSSATLYSIEVSKKRK